MTPRQRARFRLAARDYAYRWLGVRRLPAGLPAQIDAYVKGLDHWPDWEDDTLWHIVSPFKKRPLVL